MTELWNYGTIFLCFFLIFLVFLNFQWFLGTRYIHALCDLLKFVWSKETLGTICKLEKKIWKLNLVIFRFLSLEVTPNRIVFIFGYYITRLIKVLGTSNIYLIYLVDTTSKLCLLSKLLWCTLLTMELQHWGKSTHLR